MNKSVYEASVNKLLDAYNAGKLFHGDCSACAVGTLLDGFPYWSFLFFTDQFTGRQIRKLELTVRETTARVAIAKAIIKQQTDLTESELERIEAAFEGALHNSKEGYAYWTLVENEKEGQLMGLKAVIDVMSKMVEERLDSTSDQQRLKDIYEIRRKEVCVAVD